MCISHPPLRIFESEHILKLIDALVVKYAVSYGRNVQRQIIDAFLNHKVSMKKQIKANHSMLSIAADVLSSRVYEECMTIAAH